MSSRNEKLRQLMRRAKREKVSKKVSHEISHDPRAAAGKILRIKGIQALRKGQADKAVVFFSKALRCYKVKPEELLKLHATAEAMIEKEKESAALTPPAQKMLPPPPRSASMLPPPPRQKRAATVKNSGLTLAPAAPRQRPVVVRKIAATVLTEHYREVLVSIYSRHNPAKLADVEKLLKKYMGKEEKLIAALHKKYQPEMPQQPFPSDVTERQLMSGIIEEGRGMGQAVATSTSTVGKQEAERSTESIFAVAPGLSGSMGLDSTASRGSLSHEVESWGGGKGLKQKLSGRITAKQQQTNPGEALPAGFFDDKAEDARAHNIDVRVLEKQKERDEWKAFQQFSATVRKEEEATEQLMEVQDILEKRDFRIEQENFKNRVTRLKRRRNGELPNEPEPEEEPEEEPKEEEESGGKAEVGEGVTTALLGAAGKRSSLVRMLRDRKRRKKQRTAAIAEAEFTPLDPLDWRKKMAADDV